MSSTEELLKHELELQWIKGTGKSGGGCINEGTAYDTDKGLIFVKYNSKPEAFQMFEGEYESLAALKTADQVKVPSPIKVLRNPKGGAMLVMDYIDMQGLSLHAAKLGEQMARLHLINKGLKEKALSKQQSLHYKVDYSCYVTHFGFPVTTCCGYLPQDNDWMDNWLDFFARKIDQHVRWAEEKYNDRDVGQEWSSLLPKLPKLFLDLDIVPALLHGDLWGGNAAETDEDPVIFDPASFYGHSEYDLAISKMFGGFGQTYFNSYHNLIPKQQGFNDRQDLYMMFHYFNHWNHFDGGYKISTIRLMHDLNRKLSS
ncbi:ketosamine-3-kinase [Biomphalaria glabrata]|nr:ketosamine-3-kinase-like [Biomphalaria glabrata]